MSSPSRSPSPLPPTRYFDLLPTELLRSVFNNLDELPRTRATETTLLSLCLTSKLCRSLAQPLLLKRIRIQFLPEHAKPNEAQGKVAQDLLKVLLERNLDQSLAAIETLHLNRKKHKNIKSLIVKLLLKAPRLKELYIRDEMTAVKAFFGSHITTLTLWNVQLKDSLSFPELVRLCWRGSSIKQEGALRINVPKLRHLGFFRAAFSSQEITFLTQLSPQLSTLTVHLKDKARLPHSISTSSTIAILFQYWIGQVKGATLEGVRHLSLYIELDYPEWTKLIGKSDHQLETLILSKERGVAGRGGATEGGVSGERPQVSSYKLKVLLPLEAACRENGVEVIRDGRELSWDSDQFDEQVPASFIKWVENRNNVSSGSTGAE